MDISLIVMAAVVVALFLFAYFSEGWSLIRSGLVTSSHMLRAVWFRMLLGLLLGGMIQVLISPVLVSQWMSAESGFRGVLVGTVAGVFAPGGPYVHFPLLAALRNKGAGIGPLAAFMTSWALIPLNRTFVFEIPFMGVEFAVSRLLVSLVGPVAVGVATPVLMDILYRFTVKP